MAVEGVVRRRGAAGHGSSSRLSCSLESVREGTSVGCTTGPTRGIRGSDVSHKLLQQEHKSLKAFTAGLDPSDSGSDWRQSRRCGIVEALPRPKMTHRNAAASQTICRLIAEASRVLGDACLFVLSRDLGKEPFGEASAKDLHFRPQ